MEQKTFRKRIRTARPMLIAACTLAACLLLSMTAWAEDYQILEISDNLVTISDPESGESQVALRSEAGLVVFNTYRSVISAQRMRTQETYSGASRKDSQFVGPVVTIAKR